jgi:hypothetical protein
VQTVDELHHIGLFLDDYGQADCNREIIMASVQKSDDLKLMLRAVMLYIILGNKVIYASSGKRTSRRHEGDDEVD